MYNQFQLYWKFKASLNIYPIQINCSYVIICIDFIYLSMVSTYMNRDGKRTEKYTVMICGVYYIYIAKSAK